MRLLTLRLQNFRQHVDTQLVFDRGLTGIIGPNGSGKSTLLEAIAWALYGTPAARGTRESIRFSRAAPRAVVKVELSFELAGHRYRVVRGLSTAECYLDDGETPIANTLTGVSELVQRRLGMTRSEFFHTYFTGQKELDVLSALGPAERARFLSRVLGYDRLTASQALVRERRRALTAEQAGVRQGMPDAAAVRETRALAAARVLAAQERAMEADRTFRVAQERLQVLTPEWEALQAARTRWQEVGAEAAVAAREVQSLHHELERLEAEVGAIVAAEGELQPLRGQVARLPALRVELEGLEALAAAEAQRQALVLRLRELEEETARLTQRADQLATAPALADETAGVLTRARLRLAETEQAVDAERTAWARDRQEAETRLDALRRHYQELTDQLETLAGLGDQSPCPTCGRPLGAQYADVVAQLTEQRETIQLDGSYYRQRVEQLAAPPAALVTLEDARRAVRDELSTAERRLAKIQAAVAETATIGEQQAQVAARRGQVETQLAALPAGYDADRHAGLRREVAERQELERQVGRLEARLERGPAVRAALTDTGAMLAAAQQREKEWRAQQVALGVETGAFESARETVDAALATARQTELERVSAAAEVTRALEAEQAAEAAGRELDRLEARLTELEADRRHHEALDELLTELRADLNAQLRPELAELAGGFLEQLTDGRYATVEFDEDYRLVVLEDGTPKPVLSGGEEDLCNLVLRLAVSQMIAERAGQAFSLLVLDEVFGSLDEARRGNVISLLRRLQDQFEQVIVITHIEQVRDGLDRLLPVRLDVTRGCSVVEAA